VSVSTVDGQAVADYFGLAGHSAAWVTELDALPVPSPAAIADPATLADQFTRLGGDRADLAELQALRPRLEVPAVRWLLDRCAWQLIGDMGSLVTNPQSREWPPWPLLASADDPLNRYFYVFVFLAGLPAVREFHQSRGISDEISWASLADLGQQMSVYRRIYGTGGLHTQVWLTIPFRGLLYRLGRLQYNLSRIDFDQATIDRLGLPFRPGDQIVGVHIPEQGRLDPASCDASLRLATEFFDAHFPEWGHRFATCHSWLLDPRLADYLPAESNIVQFQRRFAIVEEGTDQDAAVYEFVFRRINPTLDELPQNSALERAVVAHLRSGGHWRTPSGWLELPVSRRN